MYCFFHPQAESVVSCGKCGVAMCRECETTAFFRLDNGGGQALCSRCSIMEAQSNIDFVTKALKKRFVKVVFCAFFIVLSLLTILLGKKISHAYSSDSMVPYYFIAFIFWAVTSGIANIGVKKQETGSVKEQVKAALYEYNNSPGIFSFILGTFFAPIYTTMLMIGYFRSKAQLKKDIASLAAYKEKIGN